MEDNPKLLFIRRNKMKLLVKTWIDYFVFGSLTILTKTLLAKVGVDIPIGGNILSWTILYNLLFLTNLLTEKKEENQGKSE